MGNVMDHNAHTFYCLLMNEIGEEFGAFRTLFYTVEFLLQRNEKYREVEVLLDTIENMQLASNDNVNDLYQKLAATGRDVTGAYCQTILWQLFAMISEENTACGSKWYSI